MAGNLPPILPSGSTGAGMNPAAHGGIGRAQNFSVTKLQQHTEREQAAVSMGQVIDRTNRLQSQKTTSIAHVGERDQGAAAVSANAQGHPASLDDRYDEGADRRRYAYIRGLIKERKAREADVAKAATSGKGLQVGTGKAFKSTGASSFRKQLRRYIVAWPGSYRNISASDRKVLEEATTEALKHKTTGSEITRKDRLKMKAHARDAYKERKITKEDYKDFKKIIGGME